VFRQTWPAVRGASAQAWSAPLLGERARWPAAAVLVGCAAVTAVLGVLVNHRYQPGGLDRAIDRRVQSALYGHHYTLSKLVTAGQPGPAAVLTGLLVLACLAGRRPRAALLAAIALPLAGALTEFVLKPVVGRVAGTAFSYPSGHSTGLFGLAAAAAVVLLGPQRPRLARGARIGLIAAGYVVALVIAAALIDLRYHYCTDIVGGAATGTAVVLATALALDLIRRPRPPGRGRAG
jgi:membrane-associated phospholipid phosphatase